MSHYRNRNRGPLHVCIILWDLGIGGVQTRTRDIIAKILSEHKQSKVTLMLYERKSQEVNIAPHPRLRIIVFSGSIQVSFFGFQKKIRRLDTPIMIVWLYKHMYRDKPTHVLTFLNRFSLFVAVYVYFMPLISRRRSRFIINEPVVVSEYLQRNESIIWKLLVRFAYKMADKIIVAAHSVKNDLVTNFNVPTKKIEVVRSWVKSS